MKNKDKYYLRNIVYVIKSVNDRYDFIVYYNSIEIYRTNFNKFNSVCTAFTHWLEEEYKPTILTDKEKAYLSAVIKPFRNNVMFIRKRRSALNEKEFILIELKNNRFSLPYFEGNTMYKGMEEDKQYTLEELGL